jgi:hypothetical protein
MPTLNRSGPRLLRKIGDRQHASAADHEEDAVHEIVAKEMTEEEINADPIDSDDEPAAQAPPRAIRSAQTSTSSRPAKNTSTVKTLVKATKKSTRAAKIRAPRQGLYRGGQAGNAGRGGDAEKETAEVLPASSAEKRGVEEAIFGFGYLGPNTKRRKPASTATYGGNIHASGPTYMKSRTKTFSRNKGKRMTIRSLENPR